MMAFGGIQGAIWSWKNKRPLEEALAEAVKIAALEVLRDTIRSAPRDTGTLARSYTIVDDPGGKNPPGIDLLVGTNVHYAVFQEFGTRHMAGKPHLGPALQKAKRKYG